MVDVDWFYVIMTVYETELQQYTCIYIVLLHTSTNRMVDVDWFYVIMTVYEAVLQQYTCIYSTTTYVNKPNGRRGFMLL
jgi:hypothetical protein